MIKSARIIAGKDRKTIATMVGCSPSTLQTIENSDGAPGSRYLAGVLTALARCGVIVTDNTVEIREQRAA
jgi:hypothetical protein